MPKMTSLSNGGGDLPRDPSKLRKRQDASEAPAQLELVPSPEEEVKEAPAASQPVSGGIVLVVKTCNLKESEKERKGGSVYRSCTGKGLDGRTYWWSLELDEEALPKGAVLVIDGVVGKTFGKPKDPLYPINKIQSISPYEEKSEPEAKVSSVSADEVYNEVAKLASTHGAIEILRAVAQFLEATKGKE